MEGAIYFSRCFSGLGRGGVIAPNRCLGKVHFHRLTLPRILLLTCNEAVAFLPWAPENPGPLADHLLKTDHVFKRHIELSPVLQIHH